jgi:hypothetical protein
MIRNYYNYKKNKYGAKKTKYNGRYYASGLEAQKAEELDWLLRAGEIKEWTPQYKWELYVNGKKICGYKIDFRVVNNDGVVDYIETKGAQTYDFMLKWNLTQALFDELTEGESARLYLNQKLVKQKFLNEIRK